MVIADLGEFPAPSAKGARKILADLGAPRRALVILDEPDGNVWKSFRNFPGVSVKEARNVCALDILNGGLLIAEGAAMEALVRRVGVSAGPDAAEGGEQ